MVDFLVNHALENVWCNPRQDLHVIFEPAKVSVPRGVKNKVEVMWEYITLPTQNEVYHVYQIGQLPPSMFDLMPEQRVWQRLSHVCSEQNLLAWLYTKNGVQFPRFNSWVLVTYDKNILVAVKEQPKLNSSLIDQALYIEFYSNAYFESVRGEGTNRNLRIYGMVPADNAERLSLQSTFNTYRSQTGHTYAFVNGRMVERLSTNTMNLGDVCEFVYDATVFQSVEMNVSDLDTFDSLLDEKRKYLINGGDIEADTIQYRDDLDFWLYKRLPDNRIKGTFFHRNEEDAIRMVTHRDYSIPTAYVENYVSDFPEFDSSDELVLRIYFRHSGYQRPLVHEHHRIHELYKLSDEDRRRALLGIDSTVPEWRADRLEQSNYTRIMRSYGNEVTLEKVQDAYGYNAVAKLIGNTPIDVREQNGSRTATLPAGLRDGATIYEYTQGGRLLGFYVHPSGTTYPIRNSACAMVEGVVGIGSDSLSIVYGEEAVVVDEAYSYRFYTAPNYPDGHLNDWTDVSDDSGVVSIDEGNVVWDVNHDSVLVAVKDDSRFLAYEIEDEPVDDVIDISINNVEAPGGGEPSKRVLEIPPGKIELWLNGFNLIPGLDYVMHYPRVVITNKRYRTATGPQKITVRGTGFCNADLSLDSREDVGFVRYGVLSRNARYNLRDDRVLRFVTNGRLKKRDILEFSEDHGTVSAPTIANGSPYMIDSHLVPLRNFVTVDTYELKAASEAMDQRVEDYLTLKLPEPEPTHPSIVEEKYAIVSPFCAKVISDLERGVLDDPILEQHYSSQDIYDLLADYEYLLDFDPTQTPNAVDEEFVNIHPHHLNTEKTLNIYQWTFLKRAVGLYLNDKVQLSQFVSIEALG